MTDPGCAALHQPYHMPGQCTCQQRLCRQRQGSGLLCSDEANNDKHKMERFLHEGRHSVLSCIAPSDFYLWQQADLFVMHVLPLTPCCACRQWQGSGLMSSDEANSDKHKMERFLHEGRHSVLSCIAPLAFGNLPLLAFTPDADGHLQLAATGEIWQCCLLHDVAELSQQLHCVSLLCQHSQILALRTAARLAFRQDGEVQLPLAATGGCQAFDCRPEHSRARSTTTAARKTCTSSGSGSCSILSCRRSQATISLHLSSALSLAEADLGMSPCAAA